MQPQFGKRVTDHLPAAGRHDPRPCQASPSQYTPNDVERLDRASPLWPITPHTAPRWPDAGMKTSVIHTLLHAEAMKAEVPATERVESTARQPLFQVCRFASVQCKHCLRIHGLDQPQLIVVLILSGETRASC